MLRHEGRGRRPLNPTKGSRKGLRRPFNQTGVTKGGFVDPSTRRRGHERGLRRPFNPPPFSPPFEAPPPPSSPHFDPSPLLCPLEPPLPSLKLSLMNASAKKGVKTLDLCCSEVKSLKKRGFFASAQRLKNTGFMLLRSQRALKNDVFVLQSKKAEEHMAYVPHKLKSLKKRGFCASS